MPRGERFPAEADAMEVFRPRLLGWSVGLVVTPLFLAAYFILAPQPFLPRWAGALVIALDVLMSAVLLRRQRRYRVELSADGLHAVDERGTARVRWDEVRTAERGGMEKDERLVLATRAGARVVVRLDGYGDAARTAIWQRVRGRAPGPNAAVRQPLP